MKDVVGSTSEEVRMIKAIQRSVFCTVSPRSSPTTLTRST